MLLLHQRACRVRGFILLGLALLLLARPAPARQDQPTVQLSCPATANSEVVALAIPGR